MISNETENTDLTFTSLCLLPADPPSTIPQDHQPPSPSAPLDPIPPPQQTLTYQCQCPSHPNSHPLSPHRPKRLTPARCSLTPTTSSPPILLPTHSSSEPSLIPGPRLMHMMRSAWQQHLISKSARTERWVGELEKDFHKRIYRLQKDPTERGSIGAAGIKSSSPQMGSLRGQIPAYHPIRSRSGWV